MNKQLLQKIAGICIAGTAAAFIGHGALAAARDPLWVGLFKGSLATMGVNVSQAAISDMTQIVGVADIVFGLVLTGIAVGFFGGAVMKRAATSSAVLYVLGIAAFWQAATAAAVIVAEASLFPGVWHFLADAPKFLLPIVAIAVLRQLRRAKK